MPDVLPCRFNRRIKIFAALSFLFLQIGSMALAEDDARRAKFLKSAVRIRYEIRKEKALITGHGTAFGADLSRYGYEGSKYLLSAAHNVLDKSGQPYEILAIEHEEESRAVWAKCQVVAFDTELDICLIESSVPMPEIAPLDDADAAPGAGVVLAGSPRGIPVKLFDGTLLKRFDNGPTRSSVRIPFDHGDSGGPFFSAESGKVVGIAVAGIAKGKDMDHDIGLFAPVTSIRGFLDRHRATDARPAQPASTLRTELSEKRPVRAVPATLTKSADRAGKSNDVKPSPAPGPSPAVKAEEGQDQAR